MKPESRIYEATLNTYFENITPTRPPFCCFVFFVENVCTSKYTINVIDVVNIGHVSQRSQVSQSGSHSACVVFSLLECGGLPVCVVVRQSVIRCTERFRHKTYE